MSAARYLRLCAAVCAVVCWFCTPAQAADPGDERMSVEFRDVRLEDAVASLAQRGGLRCIVPAQFRGLWVTMNLSDVTAVEALRAVATAAGLELAPLDRERTSWVLRELPGGQAPPSVGGGGRGGAAGSVPVLHPGDKVVLPPWHIETIGVAHDRKADGGFFAPYLLVRLVGGGSQDAYGGGRGGFGGKYLAGESAAGGGYGGGVPGEGMKATLAVPYGGTGFVGGGYSSGFWDGWRGDWGQTYVTATVDGKPWLSGPVLSRQDWSNARATLKLGFQIPPAERFDLHLTMIQETVGPEARCRVAGMGTRDQPGVSFTLPMDMGTRGGEVATLRVVKVEDRKMPTLDEIAELKAALAARYTNTVLHNVVSSGGGIARPGGLGAVGTEAEGSPAVSVVLEGNHAAARAGLGLEDALLGEGAGAGLTATRAAWRVVAGGLQKDQKGPPLTMLLWFPMPKVPGSWVLQLDLRSPGDQPRQWTWEFKDLPIPQRAVAGQGTPAQGRW